MPSPDAIPEFCEDPRFSVVLTDCGLDRLGVMAGIRALRPDIGPRSVKAMIDGGEAVVLEDLRWFEAKSLAERLRSLDAIVEIRNWRNEYVYENYRESKPPKPYPG